MYQLISADGDTTYNLTENVGYSTVSYDYDGMNRMTSMDYNSGESITYNYNSLSQLTSIDGFVENISYDSNGFKDNTVFSNGVVLNYDFTDEMELENIEYTKNFDSLLEFSYDYDNESNITAENDNLFGYDGKNQLTTAMLIGAAASEEIEITKYGTGSTTYDVVGNNTITDMISYEDGKFDIDWGAKSFGIDLYYSYRVKKIVLHQDGDSGEALSQDKISIYGSQYNQDDLFTEIEDYTIVPDSGDYIIEFSDSFYGRYFKITTHYNEMDSSGDVIYDSTKNYFALDSAAPVDVYYLTGGRNEFYSIDGKGNRNSKTIMSLEIESEAYTYYDGSDLIKTDGVYGYMYDDNGNLISKGSSYTEIGDTLEIAKEDVYWTYTYDLKNRLVSVSELTEDGYETTAYLYDANNYRIKRTDTDGKVTSYIFDILGNCIEETTENITTNYFFTGNRHLSKKVGETVYYYGLNNVGSTVLLTDSEGNSVWEGDVTPYGDKLTSSGELDDKVMYTGKMYDDATGMFYYNARWYDPNLGRFMTEDPIKDGDNWYMYAANNPLRFVDPTGKFILDTSAWYNNFYQQDAAWGSDNLGNIKGASTLAKDGCVITAATRGINSLLNYFYGDVLNNLEGGTITIYPDMINSDSRLASDEGFLSNGIPSYFAEDGITADVKRGMGNKTNNLLQSALESADPTAVLVKIEDGKHTINLNSFDPDTGTFTGFDTSDRPNKRNLINVSIDDIYEVIIIEGRLNNEE